MGRAGVLLVLALALQAAWAGTVYEGATIPDGAFADGSLQGELLVSGPLSFTASPEDMSLPFFVDNGGRSPAAVFLAVHGDGGWNVVKQLGVVPSGSSMQLNYTASFEYPGAPNDTSRVALIAESSAGISGREFAVHEDWTQYEARLLEKVSDIGVILVPATLTLFLLVAVFALREAAKGGVERGTEYTVRTLFLPDVRGRPASEIIADMLINPLFWVFEIACGVVLVGLILYSSLAALGPKLAVQVFIIGGAACWLLPFAYTVGLWLMPAWKREPFRFPASLFMWGILAAFLSFWVNSLADFAGRSIAGAVLDPLGVTFFSIASAIVIAPFVEEFAKGFGVLIASGHHELNDAFDGILYGFAAGAGFAAIENWFYFAVENNPAAAGGTESWLFLMVYRSVFNTIGHGWFTACTGGAIGYLKSTRMFRGASYLGFLPELGLAIAAHALFNLLAVADGVLRLSTSLPVFVFNPASVIILTGAFFAVILASLRARKRRHSAERRAQAAALEKKKPKGPARPSARAIRK